MIWVSVIPCDLPKENGEGHHREKSRIQADMSTARRKARAGWRKSH